MVGRFLEGARFGRVPEELLVAAELPPRSEEALYEELCLQGIPDELRALGIAGPEVVDLWVETPHAGDTLARWQQRFAEALRHAVAQAVRAASGRTGDERQHETVATAARRWFIDHYPLLGSLAMAFEIVDDPTALRALEISIAAVDPEARRIYVDVRRLDEGECRFVMAHELLHVGLRHDARRQGRDPFLWNVACDYVINGWLVEMGVGELPKMGALLDPSLKGLSAEGIYDRIVTDLRRYRKLATLRGQALGDLLERTPDWWCRGDGLSLDELYRRCLAQGLATHEEQCRGTLPAGLVEEVRALDQPPIPWEVDLARWFDRFFSPIDKVRSYARPSRRQSSTPDIPRPSVVLREGALDARTFGVVLDTSGSMDRDLLARALGAIASYAISREVPAVRVVFCDAAAYDVGYLPADQIAGRVRVRGRGGTVLQPGIDLLERAADFPADGPLLVITDGQCDVLRLRREHAFLLPRGRTLPFVAKGPVFRLC